MRPIAGTGSRKHVDQKERRPFSRPADPEKWCEIHHTIKRDLEECKTYLDHKKMLEKPVAHEPCWGDHHRADPDNDKQLDEINAIFGGSLSITSKTQGKKLEWEISLAQRIDMDISFEPEDHLGT
jgi:hypothetical protein